MNSIKMSFDHFGGPEVVTAGEEELPPPGDEIGRASCRERVL